MAFIIFAIFLGVSLSVRGVSGDSYSVKIGTEHHVNTIDSKFLSFTIDPKYLFSSSDKYRSKECICMASSLAPAYLRIAGPSTALLTFRNDTIAIDPPDDEERPRVSFHDSFADDLSREMRGRRRQFAERFKRDHEKIEVSHGEWRRFVQWARAAGFSLVFALNDRERARSGAWDPNTALSVLSAAQRAAVADIYWQLGYECHNQSIEEYLNDLETLSVITETFPMGQAGRWKVVGGDVTPCLHADSKSDFKDYVTLSNDLMDAILLNGNSSSQELERMSERSRTKLLKLLSESSTPLWLAEPQPDAGELASAAHWLAGLGHAARNGFTHHFRELGDDMHQPTLSFYMALLFKNLVGSKVLDVDMEADQAIMFAHCTSLRHKAVPGALTLYAVNMDDEPARFSIKLDRREDGGDIMQFILGHDSNGNIQVNGRPMYFDGDLKPVVKRVRPYKTLLLNLPAKSFGFWVLANTKINACYDEENSTENEYVDTDTMENVENDRLKAKRSVLHHDNLSEEVDITDENESNEEIDNKNLVQRITDLNQDLNKVQDLYKDNSNEKQRLKRQINVEGLKGRLQKKLRNRGLLLRKHKKDDEDSKVVGKMPRLLRLSKRNKTSGSRKHHVPKVTKLANNKVSKRNPKIHKAKELSAHIKSEKTTEKPVTTQETEVKSRRRRSADKDQVELSVENEIEMPKDNVKLWKILRKIHKQLKDLSEEDPDFVEEYPKTGHNERHHHRETADDVEESETGFIKTTVGNLMKVLSDLNKNLNRFWTGIKLLD